MLFFILLLSVLNFNHSFVLQSKRNIHQNTITMHFEEALLGNSALSEKSIPRERYIATNRFKVRKDAGAKFEKRWADRKSRIANLEGFRFFTLLKRVNVLNQTDYSEEGEFGNYISLTIWQNKDNFDTWRTGDAFKEAHGGGGITGFIQLLSTALFILEGSPKPAFYDAILPIFGTQLHFENEGGWRKVDADGKNELQPEIFVTQIKYQVASGKEVDFEQDMKKKEVDIKGISGDEFVGLLVQRRDATKADDNNNYIISIIWKNQQAYLNWRAQDLSLDINHSLLNHKQYIETSKLAFYEGKLTLSSSNGI